MRTNDIIRTLILYILSAVLSFIILLLFGGMVADFLFLFGIFGLTTYVILETQQWIKLNIFIRYTIAICSCIIYKIFELNNYEVDTRDFEFMHLGRLVKHEPEIKVFKFIDFNDLFLILLVTTMMLAIYLILKHVTNKFRK